MNLGFQPGQLGTALVMVWLVFSLAMAACVIAPHIVADETIRQMASSCSVHHDRPCIMCGMTTSFLAMSKGDLATARQANAAGPILYGFFWLNILVTGFGSAFYLRHLSKRNSNHRQER